MRLFNWRKDGHADGVEQAAAEQAELFEQTDRVLADVKRIRKSVDAIEDYAQAEKARLRRRPA